MFNILPSALRQIWGAASGLGALMASASFAAALTPSLLPHAAPFQGVLSGAAAAAGYGAAAAGVATWRYLELPEATAEIRARLSAAATWIAALAALFFAWRAVAWQNGIRALFDMPPVDAAYSVTVALIAPAVFALLLALGFAFRQLFRVSSRMINRALPPRLSHILGLGLAVALFGLAANGILFDGALRIADSSLKARDALTDAEIARPVDPMRAGAAASLVEWEAMGRAGREYIASGPKMADIAGAAMAPIRVYVGLNSAEDVAARAHLALAEMKRVGAFERAVLVVASPTGTGWLDPAAMDTLEHLHRGDVATVAVQYSYLLSWISLLVEPGYGAETSRALFREIYGHWKTLPKNARPRLYLHGLSLGAMGSERSAELFEILGDPFHGAVWSGPPFPSRIWSNITRARAVGSPAWLPRFGDDAIVRFTAQRNALDIPGADWGPLRTVYLQYASDPIVFFEPNALWREPDWMKAPRGPDVSPDMRWYPVVTFLQLLVDMALSTTSPVGHGHVYAPEHYIDAWVAVTDPPGWDAAAIAALKARLGAARQGG